MAYSAINVRVEVNQKKMERLDQAEKRLTKAYVEVQEACAEVREALYGLVSEFEGHVED